MSPLQHAKAERTEARLVNISVKIGSVAEKNSQYTHSLARRLSKLETPIDQLSIGELVEQIDLATESYNGVFGGEL